MLVTQPLQCLTTLQADQKWKLQSNGNQVSITAIKSVKGRFKNLLEFNEVTKFAVHWLKKHPNESNQNDFIQPLLAKYERISQALNKQFCLIRLIDKFILYIHGLPKHIHELKKLEKRAILTNQPTRELEGLVVAKKQLPLPPLRGLFQRGDNNCFLASALHCFHAVHYAQISKDNTLIQEKNESDEVFETRKKCAGAILAILNKLNQGITISTFEMNALREMNSSGLPAKRKGGQPWDAYWNFCRVFSLSLHISYPSERGKKKFMIDLIPKDENEMLTYQPLRFENQSHRDIRDVIVTKTGRRPQKFAYCLVKGPIHGVYRIETPTSLTFTNFKDPTAIEPLYELQGCAVGKDETRHAYVYLKEQTADGLVWVKYDDDKRTFNIPEKQVQEEAELYGDLLIYAQKD